MIYLVGLSMMVNLAQAQSSGVTDWTTSFDNEGWSLVPNGGLITGLYRSGSSSGGNYGIYHLEHAAWTQSQWTDSCIQEDWSLIWDSADQWALCPAGRAINGLWRSGSGEGRLFNVEYGWCCEGVTDECIQHSVAISLDNTGWSSCPDGYAMRGMWRGGCDELHCLEYFYCCKVIPDPCLTMTCAAESACHDEGTCTSSQGTGTCSPTFKSIGTTCDDTDPATKSDQCDGQGGCAGAGDVVKLNDGEACTDGRIVTEATCIAAASILGITWGGNWAGIDDPAGCIHANDGRDKVYFNTELTANGFHADYAEICEYTGINGFTLMGPGACSGSFKKVRLPITSSGSSSYAPADPTCVECADACVNNGVEGLAGFYCNWYTECDCYYDYHINGNAYGVVTSSSNSGSIVCYAKDDFVSYTPTCSDGIQNGGETDVDCGGPCIACPTCDDGIQNGDELEVDCGGLVCDPCASAGAWTTDYTYIGNGVCDANHQRVRFSVDSTFDPNVADPNAQSCKECANKCKKMLTAKLAGFYCNWHGECDCYFDGDATIPEGSFIVSTGTGSGAITTSQENGATQCYAFKDYPNAPSEKTCTNEESSTVFLDRWNEIMCYCENYHLTGFLTNHKGLSGVLTSRIEALKSMDTSAASGKKFLPRWNQWLQMLLNLKNGAVSNQRRMWRRVCRVAKRKNNRMKFFAGRLDMFASK